MSDTTLHVPVSFDGFLKAAVTHVPESALKQWVNKVHQGDLEVMLAKMPANSIDLVVTSPPYNLRNSTGNGMKDGRGGKWENAKLVNGYDSHSDMMPQCDDAYPETGWGDFL